MCFIFTLRALSSLTFKDVIELRVVMGRIRIFARWRLKSRIPTIPTMLSITYISFWFCPLYVLCVKSLITKPERVDKDST